jgi:DNA-binding NarL/FixJ family response regulator
MDAEARVYIVSAYSDDMLRRAARVAGAAGYYLKDNLEPLFSRLRRGLVH